MFPKEGNNVPEIRFEGFSGGWIITGLASVALVIDPHPSHRAPDAITDGIPFLGIGDLSEDGKISLKNVRHVHHNIYDEHSVRYKLEKGDFAYGRVASIGKIIDLTINIDKKYTYSPTMALVKPFKLNSEYLKSYLKTNVLKT